MESKTSSIEELSRGLLLPILVGIFSGNGGGALPASKKSIEAMKSVAVEGVGEECPVCLDEFKKEEAEAKEMPCRHRFHRRRIEKWLAMHSSCPVCRYRMLEEEDGELRVEVSVTVLHWGPRTTERMDGLD